MKHLYEFLSWLLCEVLRNSKQVFSEITMALTPDHQKLPEILCPWEWDGPPDPQTTIFPEQLASVISDCPYLNV